MPTDFYIPGVVSTKCISIFPGEYIIGSTMGGENIPADFQISKSLSRPMYGVFYNPHYICIRSAYNANKTLF